MGLFHKKRTDSTEASVLTESEIQKKLYGDLLAQPPHVVIGEREHFKEPVPVTHSSQKPVSKEESASDLFSGSQEEPVTDSDPAPALGHKSAEHTPRYVPLHDFESRAVSKQASTASGSDVSARFVHSQPSENKMAVLFRNFFNAHQDAIRRIGFWGGAALAVFFLFWGVNALNSQREVAMRTRYDIPRETPAVSSEAPEPVVERPVVITPAPVRSAPPAVADASATVATPAVTVPVKGSYVIQVVTYPTRQDAERIVKSFEQAGIRAYVEESTRPSGRLFYWVLIGGFRTEAEAQAELLKFRANEMARPFQDAFVKLRRS